jgi:rod shape-determining protein MreD
MINESRGGFGRVLVTAMLALILTVMPLPATIGWLRPDWLLIMVIYWSLVTPRVAGLAFAWICGLLIDVTTGAVLGEHALAFLLVGFLTHRLQLRMRIFPIWQQASMVLMMLLLYQFLLFWIDGITGQAVTTWRRWMPAMIGAALWPVVIAVMDTLNRRTSR